MDQREDIYSGHRIVWRWVLAGALIVLGTQSLLTAVLASAGVPVLGVKMFSIVVYLLTTTIAFLVGGAVIGVLSPGYTAWEAGFASVIAAAGSLFLAMRLLDFGGGLVVITPIAVGWGLLCGLAGGSLGERLQKS
jgi:hypothetical protein